MTPTLERLQAFYASQCNGEWEHSYGVTIETIDNPGWSVRISITETKFEHLEIEQQVFERSENDWIHIATQKDALQKFIQCACGPNNLNEAIDLALSYLK